MIIVQLLEDQEIPFLIVDSGGSRLAGLTLSEITVQVWKQGMSSFGSVENTNPTKELANGWYSYTADPADIDTLGINVFNAKHSTSVYSETIVDVVEDTPAKAIPAHPQNPEGPIG